MAGKDDDEDMADATGGAEAGGSENGDFVIEKQRLRMV